MVAPSIPVNEKERLRSLTEYEILDTLPEKDFDDITRIASEICQTPISTITLIDTNRQWFKSQIGLDSSETSREYAFCAHAINNPKDILVVSDSREDIRFKDNPLVVGDPHVIFYAGVPLVNDKGFALGTLCVIDGKPRELTENQKASLRSLANQTMIVLELRKKNIELEKSRRDLHERYTELEEFSYVVSHDIKSPVNNIISIIQLLGDKYSSQLDKEGNTYIGYLNESTERLKKLIDGIVDYYRGSQVENDKRENIDVQLLLQEIISLVNAKKEVQFNYLHETIFIQANKVALQQILLNLIVNSIKYNDKPKPVIEILFLQTDEFYHFSVKDNGMGMHADDLPKIFNLFTHLNKKDRDGNMGTGIGLSTVKKLIERLGGTIHVTSELGVGSEFTFTIKK
ncbi:MAG TPA: GAF domain-containing sensor histidine kinase [Cyclobacteriaceae bacterium]|nr:GAF domain-containing sensor histidine kinase [Cyclobacteriaceae bacterium]